jgi:hypothetical protein
MLISGVVVVVQAAMIRLAAATAQVEDMHFIILL